MPSAAPLRQREEVGKPLMTISRTIFWRRLDTDGLERLMVAEDSNGIFVDGTILTTEDGGCHVDHEWRLDSNWSALSVVVSREALTDGESCASTDQAAGGRSM
jgi:hypothetical protein